MSNNDIVIRISTSSIPAENLGFLAVLPRSLLPPDGKIIMAIVEPTPTKE